MENKKNVLTKSEFYHLLDEVLPGGKQESAKKDPQRLIFFTRLNMNGLEEMHAYSADKRLYENLEYEPFTTIENTRNYLKNLIDLEGGGILGRTAISWFVRRITDNRMIGTARLVDIDLNRQSVVWGYGIDPELWGEGYIFEIQECLKEYIFDELCLNRLSGMTMMKNERTKSALIATGCREEGVLRQFYRNYKGEFDNAWMYSLLAEDYFRNQDPTDGRLGTDSIAEQTLVDIVSRELQQNKISSTDSMASVSNWDSLSHIGVILAIEEATGFSFTPSDIAKATSIKRIHHIVNRVK